MKKLFLVARPYVIVAFALLFTFHFPLFTPLRAQTVLLAGDYCDPTVLKDGDDYYMTHSPLYYERGFLIWHSRDLQHWEPLCRANVPFTGSAWAPDLCKVNGKYYIYFPANGTNLVAWADDIRGPWHGPIDLKIDGIDPGHIVDPQTGKRYIAFSGGAIAPLSDDGLSIVGERKWVFKLWPIPKDWEVECDCLESPKIFWHDGYFHIITAQGGTAGPATSHMACDQRARSLDGPWELSPYNPLVHTYSASEAWWSKGHGTVVDAPDGQSWIVYHAYKANMHTLGRYTLAEQLQWTEDGWLKPIDNACSASGRSQGENLNANLNNASLKLSDDFKSKELGLQWAFWTERLADQYKVGDGKLLLKGKGSSPADGRKLLVTPYDESYEVSATLLPGQGEGGLLLYYNEKAFAGIAATAKDIIVYDQANETKRIPNTFGKQLKLRFVNNKNKVDIYVGKTPVATGLDVSMLHHNRFNGFCALKPALYATGEGEVTFKKFKYTSIK